MDDWKHTHQHFEKDWWNTCQNTFWEETKQQVYLKRMGLTAYMFEGKYPLYNVENKTIVDIGGGPVSPLLKCVNLKQGYVVDPCDYPQWTGERYKVANILVTKKPAEEMEKQPLVDESWIMNCLQHTISPEKITQNARKVSKLVRIFEWIDTGVSEGHPHELKEDKLNEWVGGIGKVEQLNESGCHGKCWYGIFKGDHYAEI